MKNIKFFLKAFLCLLGTFVQVNGQTTRITFPIDGMVFQQGTDGKANVPFSGLVSGIDATTYTGFGYYIETLNSQSGQVNTNIPRIYGYGFSPSIQAGYYKLVNTTINNLNKGWYKITFGPQVGTEVYLCSQVVFGVGDVYVAAGQSNASGYGGILSTELQEENQSIQTYTNNGVIQQEAVRGMFSKFIPNTNINTIGDSKINSLPFGPINTNTNSFGFKRLENNMAANLNVGIYPNGRDSWSWVPLMNKIVSAHNAPTMLFNVAVPNTNMAQWAGDGIVTNTGFTHVNNNSEYFRKMRNVLQNYGRFTGMRAILWQQGENDNWYYSHRVNNPGLTYINDYSEGLKNLIKWSRKALTGDENSVNLGWSVSQTTFNTGGSQYWTGADPVSYPLTPGFGAGRTDLTHKYISNNIRGAQQNTLGNVITGPDTDALNESYRSQWQRIHFSGNENGLDNIGTDDGLNELADGWYNSIFNSNGSYKFTSSPVSGLSALLPLSISDNTLSNPNDGNYKLTAPTGYNKYFWVKNDQSILDVTPKTPCSNCSPHTFDVNSISSEPEYYTCYVSNASDNNGSDGWDLPDLQITQSFVSRNNSDAAARALNLSTNNINFSAQADDQLITVLSNSVVWDIIDLPSWASANTILGGFGETPVRITLNPNNSNNLRTAAIKFRDQSNQLADKILNITQSATLGDKLLTTLTPTSSYIEFGSVNTNGLNAYGDGLNINGQPYTQGIGTHANSTIAYTIPSGYTHFNGLVGRDFAGCVCGDATVNFKVKLNGSVAFNSGAMGKNTNAQGFSIPLNGATQLELIVEPVNQNWGDVADWINPTLSQNASNSSGAPSPPTSVLANPATINVNASSLLTATCSQGTASWNNGAATGSPYTVSPTTTTTYDVKCVLGSNISSTQNVTVTVTVNGSGGGSCAPVTNLAVMGTWNVAGGFQLVTRDFNGAKWLVQKTNINGSQYDEFTVRGSEMLQRSDVTLTNSTYNGLINCYAWQYSGYGGLVGPNANTTPAFPTPSGYNLYNAVDGTPYYSNYVSSTYSCANLSNDLFMGTWNVGSGYELRTKHFHNNKWVTQKININGSQYDEFVVRGSAMMQRSDVTLANSNFYNLTNCYPWQYSNYGNLAVPDASTFPTPAGYQKLLSTDQTPYFTNWSSGSRIGYVENQSVEEIPFLKVSPNPSSGLFKLDIHLDRDLIINIALTDAAGKVIKDKSVIGKKGVNSLEFDATSSPAGMYLFNVNDGINQEVKKVVIK